MSQKNHIWPAYVDMMTVLLLVYILMNCMFSVIISNANLDEHSVAGAGDNSETVSGRIVNNLAGNRTTSTSESDAHDTSDGVAIASTSDESEVKRNAKELPKGEEVQSSSVRSSNVQADATGTFSDAHDETQEQSKAALTSNAGQLRGPGVDNVILQAQKELYQYKRDDLVVKFAQRQEAYSDTEKQNILSWINKYRGRDGYYIVGVFVHEDDATSASGLLTQQAELYYQLMVIFESQDVDLSKVHLRNAVPSSEIDNVVKARFVPCQGLCAGGAQ